MVPEQAVLGVCGTCMKDLYYRDMIFVDSNLQC